MIYQIRIKGQLGAQWAGWFEGMTITPAADGATLIAGHLVDQAALYGLLRKVRDLGLPLLSVTGVEAGQGNEMDATRKIAKAGEENENG